MKTMDDKQIIQEIEQRIKETDYPGSSLNNGVYPLMNNASKVVGVYYPKEKCVMLYKDNKIIHDVQNFKQAEKITNHIK